MKKYKCGSLLLAALFFAAALWRLLHALAGESGHVFFIVMSVLWCIRCLANAFCKGSYEEYLEARARHRAAAKNLFGRWASPVEYFGWVLMLVSLPWAVLAGYSLTPSALLLAGLVYTMVIDGMIRKRAEKTVD